MAALTALALAAGPAAADPAARPSTGLIWGGLLSGEWAPVASPDRPRLFGLAREAGQTPRRGIYFSPASGMRFGLRAGLGGQMRGLRAMVALELDF